MKDFEEDDGLLAKLVASHGYTYAPSTWETRVGSVLVATRDYKKGDTIFEELAMASSETHNSVQSIAHNGRMIWSMVHRVLAGYSALMPSADCDGSVDANLHNLLAWFNASGFDMSLYPVAKKEIFGDADAETAEWLASAFGCSERHVVALYAYLQMSSVPASSIVVASYTKPMSHHHGKEGSGRDGEDAPDWTKSCDMPDWLYCNVTNKVAFFPTLSRMQHACQPNCSIVRKRPRRMSLEEWFKYSRFCVKDFEHLSRMSRTPCQSTDDALTEMASVMSLLKVDVDDFGVWCKDTNYNFSCTHGGVSLRIYSLLKYIYEMIEARCRVASGRDEATPSYHAWVHETLDASDESDDTTSSDEDDSAESVCRVCLRVENMRRATLASNAAHKASRGLLTGKGGGRKRTSAQCDPVGKQREPTVRVVADRDIKCGEILTVDHAQRENGYKGALNMSRDAASHNMLVSDDIVAIMRHFKVDSRTRSRLCLAHATGRACKCRRCLRLCERPECLNDVSGSRNTSPTCTCGVARYCSPACKMQDTMRHSCECSMRTTGDYVSSIGRWLDEM